MFLCCPMEIGGFHCLQNGRPKICFGGTKKSVTNTYAINEQNLIGSSKSETKKLFKKAVDMIEGVGN
jgi:hypothetical protein